MVQWMGVIPLGSVVLLKGAYKRLQIIGQTQANRDTKELFDYVAVPFPEGYVDADHVVMFQHEDVDKIYAIGHLDDGAYSFMAHAEQRMKDLREGRITIEEAADTLCEKETDHEV